MEIKGDNQISDSWSSATSWTIASGNLVNSLTFESSLYPIKDDDDDDDDDNMNDGLNSTAKPSLVLQPSAPDSPPCEITFNFTQKHEVQQVYVRSTARVYEIYYAADFQSGNEYLCTVRCGIATRDEQVLRTTDFEDVLSACPKGSDDNLSKESLRSDSNLNSSEDDWVEVKAPDNSTPGNKENSLPSKFSLPREPITQDFYEATAQMSDVNPCVSITIRLLSLQSKDRVYVDEVYVFADPVDSTDSEKQVDQVENSTGSSFMTMLLPTLLQLSKTKSATRSLDKHTSDTCKNENSQDVGSQEADSSTSATIVRQEEKPSVSDDQKVEFQNFNRSSVGTTQLQGPSQVPPNKPDFPPNNQVERSLDELVSQMGRIEGICLRLEEKLLKPINSIEARLQRVEQQLEVLTNRPKNSGLPSCSRFYAPNFSCIESDSTSFCHSGSDYPHYEECESNKKDVHSDAQSIPADDMSDSGNATQFLPSLIVTAPEFSNCDDEEENDASNETLDSMVDKPRQAPTIDDALASALAGFVSSISIESDKNFQSVSVETHEVSIEKDGKVGKSASEKADSKIRTDGTESIDDSLSNALNISPLESEGNRIRSLNHENLDKTAGGDERCLHYEGGEKDKSCGSHVENNDDQSHHGMVGTDFCPKEIENEEDSTEVSNILVPDETDIQSQIFMNQTDIDSDTILEDGPARTNLTAPIEVTEKKSDKDILQNMFEFSCAASVVDFHIPVLDVKFVSQDICKGHMQLEDLLSGFSNSKSEPVVVGDTPYVSPSDEHGNLIVVEDEKTVGLAVDDHFSVDVDYCSLQEPLSMDNETMLGRDICSSHETFTASLI
ncbi:hypothetical protein FEM48_Zijuj05G0011200 [Ziziphus jujuba var. spinosa]|uniref:Uncharacterized protein n=1 Tax=Ziziphus jujuba var. spinosa TaxID=714518 RepID=A0A978VBX0_ZIZJJ|nr:hypothetical protein FEM48_Zijuj05G0011200 [Ziziphus jujuba var. spinosa]